MQINLKQPAIIAALKQYVQAQGINLSSKTVDITFTAGRGTTGLSAEINIEDQEPEVTTLIHRGNVAASDAAVVSETVQIQTVPAQAEPAVVTSKATTSLFG